MTTPAADDADRFPPRDPGLQGERTALAWNRTAMAVLVNGLIALRVAWSMQEAVITSLACAVIACAVITFAYAGVRRRQLLHGTRPAAAAPLSMAAIAGFTLLACAVGLGTLVAAALRHS